MGQRVSVGRGVFEGQRVAVESGVTVAVKVGMIGVKVGGRVIVGVRLGPAGVRVGVCVAGADEAVGVLV